MDRDIGSDDQRDQGPEREDRRNQPVDLARAGSNPSPESYPSKPGEHPRTPPDQPIDRQSQLKGPGELTRDLGQTKNLDRERQISRAALEAARETGRFRTLAVDDLRRLQYGGDVTAAARDLQSLSAHGLIE